VMERVGGAGQSVDVMAFHCYAGGVENQTVFHNAYPTVPIWFTECSQTGNEGTSRQFLNDFFDNLNGLYFGNLGNWGQTVLHWTMAVDEKLGPHSGGCATCSGVVTVDAGNMSRPYVVRYNSEYYTIGHFSSLIVPMSRRVVSGVKGGSGVQVLGAVTPTGHVVVQLMNEGTSGVEVVLQDVVRGECFVTTLPPQSLTSYRWNGQLAMDGTGTGTGLAVTQNGADQSTVGWTVAIIGLIGLVMSW
jgi:glucosylceramidase